MNTLTFLTQDSLVEVSSSKEEMVSRLKEIESRPNFEYAYSYKVHYLNIPCCFDIETSSFKEGVAKKAIMYIWTFNINGTTFIGRTWKEFVDLLDLIAEEFQLIKFNKRMIIYVHNLEYEFQFMRKWLKWYDIFADSKRSPLYALTENGFEFRCSYRLSGCSLAKLGKDLTKYKSEKMVGDLDYSLLRHSETMMTESELRYCTQDTKTVVCYIQECIEKEGNIAKLPYTKTGYVRRYCMRACYTPNDKDPVSRLKAIKYRDLIHSLTLTYDQYLMCKRAFQGGFTHANVHHVDTTINNVTSLDIASDYPYCMLSSYFPMSSPIEKKVKTKEMFLHCLENYCCLFDIEFKNIRPKVSFENIISLSRCTHVEGYTVNNGRIIQAKVLRTTITELDFLSISNFYSWDDIAIGKFYIFYKGYLPTRFTQAILDLYKNKTTLKGIPEKLEDYMLAKAMLNSAYGMCVTDIVREQLEYSQEKSSDGWVEEADTEVSQLTRYNESCSRFLYYPWGVWVTAHARHNLFKTIYEFGNDYVYSDTDSIKAINFEKHKDYIDKYNQDVREKLMKAAEFHGIPFSEYEPKTIKGIPKLVGVWENEGTYAKFRTLGAKRYICQKEGEEVEFTVAGIKKDSLKEYMYKHFGEENIFDNFTRNLDIPAEFTGKLTHTYIDQEWEGDIIDYMGKPYHYHELSSIHLEPAPFKLSIIDEFWAYIEGVRQIEK